MPPGWVFGVAWTDFYMFLGFSFAIILHARRARGRATAITLFVVQLALNLAWSPLFFAAHRVEEALWLAIALVPLTAVTTLLFARIRTGAGLLMLPYLAWLVFAALLTFEIHRLNPDAEALAPGGASTQIAL
jgi:tryptophan-rich sensory protein